MGFLSSVWSKAAKFKRRRIQPKTNWVDECTAQEDNKLCAYKLPEQKEDMVYVTTEHPNDPVFALSMRKLNRVPKLRALMEQQEHWSPMEPVVVHGVTYGVLRALIIYASITRNPDDYGSLHVDVRSLPGHLKDYQRVIMAPMCQKELRALARGSNRLEMYGLRTMVRSLMARGVAAREA